MRREPFFWISLFCGVIVVGFIVLPIFQLMTEPSFDMMKQTIIDRKVLSSIGLSIYTAGAAAAISFIFGTPFAYLLARSHFKGKRIIESIIDLPIVIPHPVVGIAFLSIAGKNHWMGQVFAELGIRMMGSVTGIITVLTFVGMPFYINAAKNGFESIPTRLESVSRSLGASMFSTFFRITFPLSLKSMLIGLIMCAARAVSEFGAVIIIAYHPMNAPVLIYERFEAYGIAYSLPVSVWLVFLCLVLFIALRMLTHRIKGAV
jgi:molybdate/tungstate transport system permease protein